MKRYIFVTGGVVSSLGKGVAAASIGSLLQAYGYRVKICKFDPYLNIDPGTMSPLQHGEVYVTNDGYETDLDLGYYERFLGIELNRCDSISGGRIYWDVLTRERRGDYLGSTVQTIPHVTDQIKHYIKSSKGNEDFVIYEIGGTVGDIEGQVFLEAIRQFSNDVGRKNVMFVHLTLIPYISTANELKTKPTQHSVRQMLEAGIQVDMLLCRSAKMLSDSDRKKVALFCNLSPDNVITALDMDSIYKIPSAYRGQCVDKLILQHFGIRPRRAPDFSKWTKIEKYLNAKKRETTIAMVGKYFDVPDAYKSLAEAIFHAGIANNVVVNIKKVNAEDLEKMNASQIRKEFAGVNGILIPGGFGNRGVDGKMIAIKHARENKIPFLGICLGMQLAVIEFARNVMGIKNAHSTEFTNKCTPIISLMSEWDQNGKKTKRSADSDLGGTLRLGGYPCVIEPKTLAHKIYGKTKISERHRHRYELDLNLCDGFEKRGLIVSGKSPDGKLPEIIELKNHPFFIAGQFHPEFQSSPFTSHPLFCSFIQAGLK